MPEGLDPRVAVTDHQTLLTVALEDVVSVATFALKAQGCGATVEIALVDNRTIADLHQRFLGKPGATDVITFPLAEESPCVPEGPPKVLGEIVVSTECAIQQAPSFSKDPVEEVLLYVVHGVLHLLGYDDREPETRTAIEGRQRQILASWLQQQGRFAGG